jgi:hypothetical protein
MNLQFEYSGSDNLVAIIYNSNGTKVWNPIAEIWVSPITRLLPLDDLVVPVGHVAGTTYSFDFVPPEVGSFLIGVYEISSGPPYTYTGLVSNQTLSVGWSGSLLTSTSIEQRSYSDLVSAAAYFAAKLYTEAWFALDISKQQAALNHATQIIDIFNYIGTRTLSTQDFEWPRDGVYLNTLLLDKTIVPNDILFAQYEIALALAKGIDPERELKNLRVTGRGYSSVRTTYDPRLIPEHLKYGVPSFLAWSYLSTYLNRGASGIVRIHKVN